MIRDNDKSMRTANGMSCLNLNMEDYQKLKLRSGLPSTTCLWILNAEKNMSSMMREKIHFSRYKYIYSA